MKTKDMKSQLKKRVQEFHKTRKIERAVHLGTLIREMAHKAE